LFSGLIRVCCRLVHCFVECFIYVWSTRERLRQEMEQVSKAGTNGLEKCCSFYVSQSSAKTSMLFSLFFTNLLLGWHLPQIENRGQTLSQHTK